MTPSLAVLTDWIRPRNERNKKEYHMRTKIRATTIVLCITSKSQYDDPDDVDELRQCIQNATDEYESCIEECNS